MKVNFQAIAVRGTKVIKCRCGKKLKRTKKIWQTINPFNRIKDKLVDRSKTADGIMVELKAELADWKQASEVCDDCIRETINRG